MKLISLSLSLSLSLSSSPQFTFIVGTHPLCLVLFYCYHKRAGVAWQWLQVSQLNHHYVHHHISSLCMLCLSFRIKLWWLIHHYCSIAIATLLLTWSVCTASVRVWLCECTSKLRHVHKHTHAHTHTHTFPCTGHLESATQPLKTNSCCSRVA